MLQDPLNKYEAWLLEELSHRRVRGMFNYRTSPETLAQVLNQDIFPGRYHEPYFDRQIREMAQLGLIIHLPDIDSDVELRIDTVEKQYDYIATIGQAFRSELNITKEIKFIIHDWEAGILPTYSEIIDLFYLANQDLQTSNNSLIEF